MNAQWEKMAIFGSDLIFILMSQKVGILPTVPLLIVDEHAVVLPAWNVNSTLSLHALNKFSRAIVSISH